MEFAWGKRWWQHLLVLSYNFGKCFQYVKTPGVGSMWREGILQRIPQCLEVSVHEVPLVDPGGLGSCSAGHGIAAPGSLDILSGCSEEPTTTHSFEP